MGLDLNTCTIGMQIQRDFQFLIVISDEHIHGFAEPKNPYRQTLSTARPGVQSAPDCQ